MPSFRVVGIAKSYDMTMPISIGIYSSETWEWKRLKIVCTEMLISFKFDKHAFVYNGVIHWFIISSLGVRSLVVYDSNVDDSNVDECFVQIIKLPLGLQCHFTLARSPIDDVLWVGMSNRETIKVWMLPKDKNGRKTTITADEWILAHTIDNESLSKEMALLLERKNSDVDETAAKANRFLKLEALIPWNPLVAVLTMRRQVFLHNLETKSTELVRYQGFPLAEKATIGWYPFMESLHLSTYAPFPRAYD